MDEPPRLRRSRSRFAAEISGGCRRLCSDRRASRSRRFFGEFFGRFFRTAGRLLCGCLDYRRLVRRTRPHQHCTCALWLRLRLERFVRRGKEHKERHRQAGEERADTGHISKHACQNIHRRSRAEIKPRPTTTGCRCSFLRLQYRRGSDGVQLMARDLRGVVTPL